MGLDSYEVAIAVKNLRNRIDSETMIRELIMGDYLLLYAKHCQDIYLLSIKHRCQLSFDLHEYWLKKFPPLFRLYGS